MTRLVRLATALTRVLALIGALGVLLMMVHICIDVLARNLFSVSIHVTTEMVARFYMVSVAFLPLGWLEMRRDMVSVELIDFAMPPLLLKISDVAVCLISGAIYAVLAWVSWGSAISNWHSGTYVELVTFKMPVWQSYFLPPLGFAVAALACVVLALDYARPGTITGTEDHLI